MADGISMPARQELLVAVRARYGKSKKNEKARILDELVSTLGCHRKYAIRLLKERGSQKGEEVRQSRRVYDEAVREALVVLWEAADRICGKRLVNVLKQLVVSMERCGHIDLDPEVRSRVLSVSAATIDRLLRSVRESARGNRKRRRVKKTSSRQIPTRTFADWKQPPPGFLEIDFVVHCGGLMSGSFLHSLVVTWANFQVDGKQVRESLKTRNKKEARARAEKLETELLTDTYERAPEPITIAEAIESYMNHVRSIGRKPKTVGKYQVVLDRVAELAECRNIRRFSSLNLAFADAYRAERFKVVSPITVYHEMVILCQLGNYAKTRRMVAESPFRGIKLERPKPTPQPCWSFEETERILAASSPGHRPAFTLLRETGMRIGELVNLTWEDVDLQRGLLLIRPKAGWTPKSGDQRAIPLSPMAKATISGLLRSSQWVVTAPPSREHPKPGRQMSERRALAAIKRVVKRLKLKGHLYTFRHSFISHALVSGTPVSTLKSWVGHVSDRILALYTHVSDVDSIAAMQRLSERKNQTETKPEGSSPGKSIRTVSAQSASATERPCC